MAKPLQEVGMTDWNSEQIRETTVVQAENGTGTVAQTVTDETRAIRKCCQILDKLPLEGQARVLYFILSVYRAHEDQQVPATDGQNL
jgi:hypothetical protein